MNEEQMSILVKESVMRTPKGFTETLMKKVEVQNKTKRAFVNAVMIVSICSVIIVVLVLTFDLSAIPGYHHISNVNLLIQVATSLFIFSAINRLLSMRVQLKD